MSVDVAELKRRAAQADKEPEAPVRADQGGKPRLPPALLREMGEMVQEMDTIQKREESDQAQAEERIDMGELSPEAQAEADRVEAQDEALRSSVNYTYTPSDNPDVRKIIESRCDEMDFGDLMATGRITQDVIITSRVTIKFQSLLASEVWWVEERASDLYNHNMRLAGLWAGYAKLVLGLVEIMGRRLPNNFETEAKEITQKSFDAKWNAAFRIAEPIVELAAINCGWFKDRVAKLFTDDFGEIKNG